MGNKPPEPRRSGFLGDMVRVSGSLFESVVLPAVKELFEEYAVGMIRMLIHKSTDNITGGGSSLRAPRYQYDLRSRPTPPVLRYNAARVVQPVVDVAFPSKEQARLVVEAMWKHLQAYRHVSVLDYYAMCGIEGDHTHDRYGWSNLDAVQIRRSRDGEFYIDLPLPEYN